jgi:hypothetical protein
VGLRQVDAGRPDLLPEIADGVQPQERGAAPDVRLNDPCGQGSLSPNVLTNHVVVQMAASFPI